NLDPGSYLFRVKSSNSDGVWNESSANSLRVVILPPYWATWWFRGLVTAFFVLALFGIHRLRVRRLTADIAERKRAELALRQAEEKYRRLFEEDLSADVIATPDGRVLDCNPSFLTLFGFDSVEDAKAHNLASLHPNPRGWEVLVQMVRDRKRLEYYEGGPYRRDGVKLNVIANIVGVFDDDKKLVEIRMYVFDNTEHKKLQGQLLQAQKMEAIGRLAGGVAHDFNNWLTPIIGYSQLLMEEIDTHDPKRRRLEEIGKAGQRASVLADQLLAFSRKQVMKLRVLNLNQTVGEMKEMIGRLIGADIELTTHLDPELGHVRVDPGQIEQVIMNLVVNARDAMPGGGKLILETRNVDVDPAFARQHLSAGPGSYIILSVSDTGVGMNTETQSHIFEPFYTTKEKGKGTGLGLSTAYGIIKQSGGDISVYSEPGRGTTFNLYLPRVDEVTDAPRRTTPAASPRGVETVLLAEDEPAVRDFVAVALRTQGYTVIEAENGQKALALAREYPKTIHLLVTDVVMPKMSGPELASRFTALRPQSKILYVSGYTGDAIVDHGVLRSGLAFLQKPFTPDTLGRKVREVLDTTKR
ncbi:MAG TPA: ATP-binding protein, partial [Blastocatellia bacterium]|nr:ATP-binding protein [Blastocatellia bacterium]